MLDDRNDLFNYSSKEFREGNIPKLLALAQSAREPFDILWRNYDNYYDGIHETITELDEVIDEDSDEDYTPILTDPFIHIESQIDPTVPEPEFKARDCKNDYKKAKQREYVVKYILAINDMKSKNTQLDRPLKKYGDAFLKVYYAANALDYQGAASGELKIGCIKIDDLYFDPDATCIEDCEYIDHLVYMHKSKAKREYAEAVKKAKLDWEDIVPTSKSTTQSVSDTDSVTSNAQIQIIEHWYRDDEGDIACSIIINSIEIKHIPKYWINTQSQNKNYPFVHFYRIADERMFYNTSELKAIIPLVKTADDILRDSLANAKLMANDVWIHSEGALAPSGQITNEAGGVIITTAAGFNQVKRAGGITPLANAIPSIQFIQEQIQRTIRNYDTNTGKETARVTTASGQMQLREDAAQQANIKDSDRMQAYKRLFILLDWSALEFYDEDKMIFIGVPENEITNEMKLTGNEAENMDASRGNVFFTFNSEKIRETSSTTITGIDEAGENEVEEEYYYPLIDADINAVNGIKNSKSLTIEVLGDIMQTPLTAANYKVAIMRLKELNIPQTEEIVTLWKMMFETKYTPEEEELLATLPEEQQAIIRANPRLMDTALKLAEQKQTTTPQGV